MHGQHKAAQSSRCFWFNPAAANTVRMGWTGEHRFDSACKISSPAARFSERSSFNDDARFTLAMSDGTLVEGRLDDTDTCHFAVALEGAGITRIIGSSGAVLRHEWALEWIAISGADQSAKAEGKVAELPLFPDLEAVELAETHFSQDARLERMADRLIGRH
jgi:hypothetical protein